MQVAGGRPMNQRTPEYGEVQNSSRVTPAPAFPTQLDSRHRPQRCAGLFRLWPLTNRIPWNSLSSASAPGRLLPHFRVLPWSLALLHPMFFRPHSFHIAYNQFLVFRPVRAGAPHTSGWVNAGRRRCTRTSHTFVLATSHFIHSFPSSRLSRGI